MTSETGSDPSPARYVTSQTRYAITGDAVAAGYATRLGASGVDLVQLRMKSAPAAELLRNAERMMHELRAFPRTKLLVNGRADVAIAAGAHGVALTARPGELEPAQVRALYAQAHLPAPTISQSAHTIDEVQRAADGEVDWILFGPVFEKRVAGEFVAAGSGLDALAQAARGAPARVLALGGVTAANAADCLAAGAAGVAGIRLFS